MLALEQILNGLQYGVMLFLMSAGLTLVFGIMNFVNLAHGSLYMAGAFVCASIYATTGSFALAVASGISAATLLGLLLETTLFRVLYTRDHLHQVLATFGLTLFFNELVHVVWGPTGLYAGIPPFLAGHVELLPAVPYPLYRLALIIVGLVVAALLYLLISWSRPGMLIRASASNRIMASTLGVNVRRLYTFVFALGAALAGLAGLMAGPILNVESGMGDNVLTVAFVVIVIGGIGSIRGAFVAALLVGMVDTLGRAYLRGILATFMPHAASDSMGPALASMLVYLLMAGILFLRPEGLFPQKFLVDMDAPGVSIIGKTTTMMGDVTYALAFDDVRVPAGNLIGEEGQGMKLGQAWIASGRVYQACRGLGVAQRCIELATSYAKQRVTFGAPLSERQAIQFMLADSYMEKELGQTFVYRTAWRSDHGKLQRQDTYAMKTFCTELGFRVADRCLQIHGGMGLMTTLPIQKMWRDSRSFMITEGAVEVMRMALAREVLRMH